MTDDVRAGKTTGPVPPFSGIVSARQRHILTQTMHCRAVDHHRRTAAVDQTDPAKTEAELR